MSNETPNHETERRGFKPGDIAAIQGTVVRVDDESHEITIRDSLGKAHVADSTTVSDVAPDDPRGDDDLTIRINGKTWEFCESSGGFRIKGETASPVMNIGRLGPFQLSCHDCEATGRTPAEALNKLADRLRERIRDASMRQEGDVITLKTMGFDNPPN